MQQLGRRDTAPELALRSALHAYGLRYRVAYAVPGISRRSIDIAFTKRRVAVFVDGCFWHSCPEHGTQPRSNKGWWQEKLNTNRARDADTTNHLEHLGWRVVRVWEHEPLETAVHAVLTALRGRG